MRSETYLSQFLRVFLPTLTCSTPSTVTCHCPSLHCAFTNSNRASRWDSSKVTTDIQSAKTQIILFPYKARVETPAVLLLLIGLVIK